MVDLEDVGLLELKGDFPARAASLPGRPAQAWAFPPPPRGCLPSAPPRGRDGLGLGPQGPAAFPSAGGKTRASAEPGRPAAAGPSPRQGRRTPGGSRAQPCAPSPGGACPPPRSRLGDGERVLLPPHAFRDGAVGLSAQRATQAGPGTRQPLRREAAEGGGACPGNKRGATSGAPVGSARGALGTAPAPVAERPPAHPDPRCRRRRLLREMGTLRPLPPSCCDFGAHDLGGWHPACPTGTQSQRETPEAAQGGEEPPRARRTGGSSRLAGAAGAGWTLTAEGRANGVRGEGLSPGKPHSNLRLGNLGHSTLGHTALSDTAQHPPPPAFILELLGDFAHGLSPGLAHGEGTGSRASAGLSTLQGSLMPDLQPPIIRVTP
ncbi:collagen alpha-2(I) chain-like [Mustela erminea]|uniref:collagen alpha-2(I) chain-like n=1 Tax=Mustela erminea TaxID=36723 RepID=UPI0013869C56|nr:collagen alpha-2(I) chain-like [Mustela erminea]